MLKFVMFFLSIWLVFSEDYYKTLGVSRTASDAQIRKAFKKLSLKFHPDKNKNNPDKAKEMFTKIANAYEILKDPKTREIYDQHGEEGVKQHTARESQGAGGGGGFDDIFNNFFGGGFGGGGGGGQRFTFNFGGGGGGGGGFHEGFEDFGGGGFHQQEQQVEEFFDKSEVFELNIGGLSKFFRRNEVWIMFFYKPTDQACKNLKDTIRDLADKYYGIFKVAAVNCLTESELCEDEFNVYDYPSLVGFPSNIRSEGIKYRGDFTVNKLASFAVSHMESFVEFVSSSNYETFIRQDIEKNYVLLFTAKKSTPPLFKALSKDFKGKLIFGESRQSDKELIDKFQINKFPTLLVVTDPYNYKGVIYEGDYKKDQIMKFLREYAYSSQRSKRTKSTEFQELSMNSIQKNTLCGKNDANLCFLILIKENEYNLIEKLSNFLSLYHDDPINFFFANSEEINQSDCFNKVNETPAIFIIKGKRQRFTKFEGNFNYDLIKNFIDNSLGGGNVFQRMKNSMESCFLSYKTDL